MPTSASDKVFSWATPDTPGCAVAVSQNGQQVVNRAYGLAEGGLMGNINDTPSVGSPFAPVDRDTKCARVKVNLEER